MNNEAEWCRCCEWHKSYLCKHCEMAREPHKELFPEAIHPKQEAKSKEVLEMLREIEALESLGNDLLKKVAHMEEKLLASDSKSCK